MLVATMTCRLLALMETEQNTAVSKDARNKQIRLQQQRQQQQQHGSRRFQANQDGPGDLRPAGQRCVLHGTSSQTSSSKLMWSQVV